MKSRITVNKKTGQLKLFLKLRHVMLARGNESNSMFSLNYVQVAKDRICASNGHCLCIAEFPDGHGYMEGYYLPLKSTKTMIDLIRDPDFKGDFPDVDKLVKIDNGECVTVPVEKFCLAEAYTLTVRSMHKNNTVDLELFKKFADFASVEIPKQEHTMLKFVDVELSAYAMPMHI